MVCLHLGARAGDRYLAPLLLLDARGPSVLLPWGGAGAGAGPVMAASSAPGAADISAGGSGSGAEAARGERQAVLAQ